jgi:hypothetical protein
MGLSQPIPHNHNASQSGCFPPSTETLKIANMATSNNVKAGDHAAMQAWEDFIEGQVYPRPATRAEVDYRNYDNPARETVREFYQQNHR